MADFKLRCAFAIFKKFNLPNAHAYRDAKGRSIIGLTAERFIMLADQIASINTILDAIEVDLATLETDNPDLVTLAARMTVDATKLHAMVSAGSGTVTIAATDSAAPVAPTA